MMVFREFDGGDREISFYTVKSLFSFANKQGVAFS